MDDTSKLAVIEALNGFSRRAQEVIDRIDGRRSIGAFERANLQMLYSSLKDDVKDAAQRGKVDNDRMAQTNWERYYFAPAVQKAANALRARSNTNPITSNWIGSLLDAESEFSYYLYQLEKDHPGEK